MEEIINNGEPAPQPPEAKVEDPDRVVVTLRRPVTLRGKQTVELVLDFGRLSTRDFENIDAEMTAGNVVSARNVAISSTYAMYIAARAAGVNINEFHAANFHPRDAYRIVQVTQNFCLG